MPDFLHKGTSNNFKYHWAPSTRNFCEDLIGSWDAGARNRQFFEVPNPETMDFLELICLNKHVENASC
jgi:hypothetical protein